MLAEALAQLPAEWSAGHGIDDYPELVEHRVLIRADAGGVSHWFTEECVHRNLEYSFGFHIHHRVRDGVMMVPTDCWHPAVDGGGARRDGAEVIELTDFVDLPTLPARTRLTVRRERPHPGAQLSLFDTMNRRMPAPAFIMNQTSSDVAALEHQQRQRARAENLILDVKTCGLANLPFDDIVNNEVWMNLCFAANDVPDGSQRIGCAGQLRRATPKPIRHRLLHVAARVTPNSRRLRLDHDWRCTQLVVDAIQRVRTAFRALTVNPAPSAQAAL